ncbi:hypothetical protein [Thioflexithrix psekupsensis]|nr:hypothetical protein [Thioflexithrix psekupsensis]
MTFRYVGYFVEWECGADLSADTIEAHWQLLTHTNDFCEHTQLTN